MRPCLNPLLAGFLALSFHLGLGQIVPQGLQKPAGLTESGQVVVAGQSRPYMIRRLPLNSFPELPSTIVESLNARGCLIPQTYEARGPENVVHASLRSAGSSDWAVLCSAGGNVSLLVFFGGQQAVGTSPVIEKPAVLGSAREMERLQAHPGTGVLGFNWGIDPVSPQRIHDAQVGLPHQPARLEHDALADSVVDHRTIYHFYANQSWTVLEVPE